MMGRYNLSVQVGTKASKLPILNLIAPVRSLTDDSLACDAKIYRAVDY